MADLAGELARIHLGMTVKPGLSNRYANLLEERWDMSIRIANLADSRLRARKLAEVRHCVCVSPAYLAAHETPVSI